MNLARPVPAVVVLVLVLVLELDAEEDFLGTLVRDLDSVLDLVPPPDFFDLELDFFFFDLEGYHISSYSSRKSEQARRDKTYLTILLLLFYFIIFTTPTPLSLPLIFKVPI